MSTTVLGPISESQINNCVYVGELGFPNIQAAVNFTVAQGNFWLVLIPHGYTQSDLISSVTGGTNAILLRDERDGQIQLWGWGSTSFTPFPFEQFGGFIAKGEPVDLVAASMIGFDPNGTSGIGTGNIRVAANPGKGMPSFQIMLEPQDGTTPTQTFFRCEMTPNTTNAPRVLIPLTLQLLNDYYNANEANLWVGTGTSDTIGAKGMSIATVPSNNEIAFQAQTMGTAFDQIIRLNALGGDVEIAASGTTHTAALQTNGDLQLTGGLNMAGDTHQTGNLFLAGNAWLGTLTALEVTGGDISGNPTTLAIVGNANVSGNLTLAADPTQPLQAATKQYVDAHAGGGGGGATYPPAGIPVSTGTAWGTSLDPNNSYLPLTGGTVNGNLVVNQSLSIGGTAAAEYPNLTTDGNSLYFYTWTDYYFRTGYQGQKTILTLDYQAGATFSGPVTLPADPTAPLQAATKQYVDSKQTQIIQAPDEATALSESTANPTNIYFWSGGTTGGGGGNMVYPGAGIGVSTGNTWGTSIDPTTIAYVNTSNTFTGAINTGGPLGISTNSSGSFTSPTGGSTGLSITANVSNGDSETDFINYNVLGAGSGGFFWYNVAPGTTVNSSTPIFMALSGNAALSTNGGVIARGTVGAPSWDLSYSHVQMCVASSNPILQMVNSGAPTDQKAYDWYVDGNGSLHARLINDANNSTTDWMQVVRTSWNAYTTNFGTSYFSGKVTASQGLLVTGSDPIANDQSTARISWGSNTTFIDSIGDSSGNRGTFSFRLFSEYGANEIDFLRSDGAGNATFYGTITAASKAFKITHPLDETKHLIHACLEGPENGVFYRGEDETVKGLATVALPDYFEALTLPEDRTVTLTQISENGREEFSMLMASRVKKGLFYVRSSEPSVKFFWEVKAVRKDVPPLEVEPLKEKK